jgi:hypothetical protein
MSIVAGVYGLPVHFSGWNTKFIRKDLNGKEAYHCASYDLFNFIPIIGAYIVQDTNNRWRLQRECDEDGEFLQSYYFERDDITITTNDTLQCIEFTAVYSPSIDYKLTITQLN